MQIKVFLHSSYFTYSNYSTPRHWISKITMPLADTRHVYIVPVSGNVYIPKRSIWFSPNLSRNLDAITTFHAGGALFRSQMFVIRLFYVYQQRGSQYIQSPEKVTFHFCYFFLRICLILEVLRYVQVPWRL